MDDFLNAFEKVKEKMTRTFNMVNKEVDNPNLSGGNGSGDDRDLNIGNKKKRGGFDEFNLGTKHNINFKFMEIKPKGHFTTPNPFKFNHHKQRLPPSNMGQTFVRSIKKYPLHDLLNTEHMLNLKNLLRHIAGVITERPLIESDGSQVCN